MIQIQKLSRRFGAVEAVRSVDLSLRRGEFLTIVGPSGCGKTTLLRMIAGFEEPTGGSIEINGEKVRDMPPYKRSIGMVFQTLALFPHMTVAQNVAYPLKMRRFDPAGIPDRVAACLGLVRLSGLERRRPHQLSGGQRQRVAIARALSFGPDLLLLDEPLSALDRTLREDMQLEFRRIQRELGVTTINVTHDQREALVMSDRILVMKDGGVQQAATPVDVYRQPRNTFVASFIGTTSVFQGRVESIEGAYLHVKIGQTTVRARSNGEPARIGGAVDCAIRAEQPGFVSEPGTGPVTGPGDASRFDTRVDGRVIQSVFEGDRIIYTIEVAALGGAVLRLADRNPAARRPVPENETVRIGWNARDLFAFPASQPGEPEAGRETGLSQERKSGCLT